MTAIDLSQSMLPDGGTQYFLDSAFFQCYTISDLPSIEKISAAPRKQNTTFFPHLGLAVKKVARCPLYPSSAAEGQCLWALRRFLPEVRVPEVYGWRREEDGNLYLFMELIKGDTLSARWFDLDERERLQVCQEAGAMIRALRRLRLKISSEDHQPFVIGAIGGQPLADSVFFGEIDHPYTDTCTFYDHLTGFSSEEREIKHREWPELHPRLAYDSPVVFTHGDLNFTNIMICRSSAGDLRVAAIIDWERSGWMPSYWEYCRVKYLLYFAEEEVRDSMTKGLDLIAEKVEDEFFRAVGLCIHSCAAGI